MKFALVVVAIALAFAAPILAQRGRESSSRGDPLMEAFDGTPFWFHGVPGRYYNLISEQNVFQVATLLKEANNAVHIGARANGTYMQGVAFRQADGKVIVETFADDSAKVKVMWGTEELKMEDGEVVREMTLSDGSKMSLRWSLFVQGSGTTVTISTDAITLNIYEVPPSYDEDNFWQPSYLNMNATLNRVPTAELQGVIGDTYNYRAKGAGVMDDPLGKLPSNSAVYPVFPDFTYEIANYFSSPRYTMSHQITHAIISARRAAHLATEGRTAIAQRRRLIERSVASGMSTAARCFTTASDLGAWS